ncbi:hemerythrin domain-containing protein [Methanobacterium sp. ACI-7]|uniref:hemerythrin domain-containing protein n=1 Tax=unclassified Methanobacterium TaxID=2627676 RepID=UPI0039C35ECF
MKTFRNSRKLKKNWKYNDGGRKFCYPKAKKADKELVEHGIEEHNEAKGLIKELDKPHVNSKEFMPKLKELKNAVEHHIQEEENKLFPKNQKTLEEDEEEQIATQIEEEKSKMI